MTHNWPKKPRVLHLDFETFSHRDLRKVGAYRYVRCPHFTVTVVAWAFDDDPVVVAGWPRTSGRLPEQIVQHVHEGGPVHAWNAVFEFLVLRDHYGLLPHVGQMVCTMQRALAWGLPGKLEDAGPALSLAITKDPSARRLMLQMGKPKKDGTTWHASDPGKLNDLRLYCMRDVEAEREVGRHVPMLSGFERQVSNIDAVSNSRGVMLDRAAIQTLIAARERTKLALNAEVRMLTGGLVTKVESQLPALKLWLAARGVNLPSLDKAGVAEVLKFPGLWPADVVRVLELRQMAGKSSLNKLETMLAVEGDDGRARGLLQYYGAGRTGRWAGRLIQVQNLPRSNGVDCQAVLDVYRAEPAGLELFWPRPLDALSGALRGCLTASQGKKLGMIDLSQIEARVLAWLAGQEDILEVFRRGEDVYTYATQKLGSRDRQLGKVVTLACGYQMGAARFQETALSYGLTLTLAEAERAVSAWRQANPKIVHMWWDMDAAARMAIQKPGVPVTVGKTALKVKQGKLLMRKPNGGVLVYHNPRLQQGEVTYDGVHQETKRWGRLKTYGGKLVENLTQAVARDIVAEALVAVEAGLGLIPVMSVHDELVYEVDDRGAAERIKRYVDAEVPWGKGLPLASKLDVGFRYGK